MKAELQDFHNFVIVEITVATKFILKFCDNNYGDLRTVYKILEAEFNQGNIKDFLSVITKFLIYWKRC